LVVRVEGGCGGRERESVNGKVAGHVLVDADVDYIRCILVV